MLFVFTDIVAAESHTRQEKGHGWLWIHFQTEPRGVDKRLMSLQLVRQRLANAGIFAPTEGWASRRSFSPISPC